jgi:hypothetical protein
MCFCCKKACLGLHPRGRWRRSSRHRMIASLPSRYPFRWILSNLVAKNKSAALWVRFYFIFISVHHYCANSQSTTRWSILISV